MSGGIDSSVTAALLLDQGLDVCGVTMRLFASENPPGDTCLIRDAVTDAAKVADQLGIEHHVLDLAQRFEREVIAEFVSEYERGRTPIPCVRCNAFIKFGDLVRYADQLDCYHIATGHYAISRDGCLYRGIDREKEQTYFLWKVDREALDRLLLPLGEKTKQETREMARGIGLASAERPESVEICFAPNDDYVTVLQRFLGPDSPSLKPGDIETEDGEVVGRHEGYARYTIGQRRGLPGGFPHAMYVTKILPDRRAVIIGPEAALWGKRVELEQVNWLAQPRPAGDTCRISTRYRSRTVEARITGESRNGAGLLLDLSEPLRAITPGQSGVLYGDDDRLLGGGEIS